jgi:hypothetical protein
MAADRRALLHPTKGLRSVKIGFSWPAFFFSALWAAVMGMWSPYFTYLLFADIILWFTAGVAEAQGLEALAIAVFFFTIAYAIVRGRYGNRWLVASLVGRGYKQPGGEANAT